MRARPTWERRLLGVLLAGTVAAAPASCVGPQEHRRPLLERALQPDEPAVVARLRQLEQQGLQAEQDLDHGRLSRAGQALADLPLAEPANVRLRDELVVRFRARAAVLRDGLHRFLFVELQPLPPEQRRDLLASADRGDGGVLGRCGSALADGEFQAGGHYLRPTVALRAGATDPQTGLPVRGAGLVNTEWQDRLNEGFNARMRRLVTTAGPVRPATVRPTEVPSPGPPKPPSTRPVATPTTRPAAPSAAGPRIGPVTRPVRPPGTQRASPAATRPARPATAPVRTRAPATKPAP